MFKLLEIKTGEPFHGGVYDVTKMSRYSSSHGSANPFDTTITELISCAVEDKACAWR